MTVESRLEKIEQLLLALVEREQVREWYSTEQFARAIGKSEFSVRYWCRTGRLQARKKDSGRGAHTAWVIPHEELQRYQREGLLRVS